MPDTADRRAARPPPVAGRPRPPGPRDCVTPPRWPPRPGRARRGCSPPPRGRRGSPRPPGSRPARCRRPRRRPSRLVALGAEVGLDRAPARHLQPVDAPEPRQILGLEAQRLDHQFGRLGIVGVRDLLRAPGGRSRPARRAASAPPARRSTASVAGEAPRARSARRTRRPPPRHSAPRAGCPACWPGRGGRGRSPMAAPWRIAVRTQSIAVSPPPITTTRLPVGVQLAAVVAPARRRRSPCGSRRSG